MGKRLGLDIGTGSIGFALVELDENGNGKIITAGSHLFDSSENSGVSKNVNRRDKRLKRRQLRRRGNRLKGIYSLFQEFLPTFSSMSFEMWKENATSQKGISRKDVWELRKDALERILSEEELARVLYNIAKFRGWKSVSKNDETSQDKTVGKMKQGISSLEQELKKGNYKTIGECLYSLHIREGRAIHNKGAYTFIAHRNLVETEVQVIFNTQRKLGNPYAIEDFEERYCSIAFYQLQLKSVWDMVGECTYELGQKRAPKHSPSAEIFDAINMLNTIALINPTVEGRNEQLLNKAQKEQLIQQAFKGGENRILIKQVPSILYGEETVLKTNYDKGDIHFGTNAVDFCGTYTIYTILRGYNLLKEISSPMELSLEELQHMGLLADMVSFWSQTPESIMDVEEPSKTNDKRGIDEFRRRFHMIKAYFNINDETLYKILYSIEKGIEGRRKIKFKETHSLSLKALHKVLPDMKKGMLFHAVKEALVSQGESQYSDIECFNLKKIPVYLPFVEKNDVGLYKQYKDMLIKTVQWLKVHWSVYSDEEYNEEQACAIAGYMLRQEREIRNNRVLHRAVSQARKLINRIIAKHGKPDIIRIELARELGKGKEKRDKISGEQDKKRRNNERIREDIVKHFINTKGKTKEDAEREVGKYILKQKLWEEQKGECPYCSRNGVGTKICKNNLYDGDYEIDHILPWSKTFDDSLSNKVLCCSDCNKSKNNRSPWEWLSKDEDVWENFRSTVERIYGSEDKKKDEDKKEKGRKLSKLERLLFEGNDFKGFSTRSIVDTQYITSLLKNMLQQYLGRTNNDWYVQPINGGLTAVLRTMWRLPYKEREDKRHHGMDAIVIASSSIDMEQKLLRGMQQVEEAKEEISKSEYSEKEYHKQSSYIKSMVKQYGTYIRKPWKTFTADFERAYENIFVTRKIEAKAIAGLHEDKIYSLNKDDDTCYSRVPIEGLLNKELSILRNRDKNLPIERQNLYIAIQQWKEVRGDIEKELVNETQRLDSIPEYKSIKEQLKGLDKELKEKEKYYKKTKDKTDTRNIRLKAKEEALKLQTVGTKQYSKIEKEINKFNQDLESLEVQYKQCEVHIQELENNKKRLQDKLNEYERDLNRLKQREQENKYPMLPNTQTPIKKVWISQTVKPGVTYKKWMGKKSDGVAKNDSQIRVDIFQHKIDKTWTLVIIYADDLFKKNKTGESYLFRNPKECYSYKETVEYCSQYKGSKNLEDYEYKLSLQKNEYIVMIDGEGKTYHGYYNTAEQHEQRVSFIYHLVGEIFISTSSIENKRKQKTNKKLLNNVYNEILEHGKTRVTIRKMKYISKMYIDILETKDNFEIKLKKIIK